MRAPIHKMSIPCFNASNTCRSVATSVAVYIPVSSLTCFNQARPSTPIPSNPPGLVRGFHIPARNILMPRSARLFAVVITCSSVSALHGPAMIIGRLESIPGSKIDCKSSIMVLLFILFDFFLYGVTLLASFFRGRKAKCEYICSLDFRK